MKTIYSILTLLLLLPAFFCCNDYIPDRNVTNNDSIQTPWTYDSPWFFDMPSTASLRRSEKKVFAHYFTQYPISIDNYPSQTDYYQAKYFSPTGEESKFSDGGGLLRNRPLPQETLSGYNWMERNMDEEVRRAITIGMDGFACDLLSYEGYHLDRVKMLLESANRLDPGGFKIMLMPDMDAFKDFPERVAPMIKELSAYPAAYRLDDGRLVVSPFNTQNMCAAWWDNWLAGMREDGINIAFVPLFQGWEKYASQFKNISYGMSDWGWASPKAQVSAGWENTPSKARNYAKIWMMPVRPQDMRPYSQSYMEAGNSELYRIMWKHAIDGGADWVHLITWNDYSEHTCIAPSTGTQYAFYDLTAFFLAWFKTEVQPQIKRDALFYFYRRHAVNARPSVQTIKFDPSPGSDPEQNVIELVAFLTTPGTLEIQIGTTIKTKNVPAGISTFQIPLEPGKPVFRLRRNNQKIITLPGAFEIKNKITYQDLLYYGGSNTRKPLAFPEFLYKID